jgi:HEAT repeat protein
MSALQAPDFAEIRRQLRRTHQGLVDRLGAEPLAWLALLPTWTEALARHCGFPVNDLDGFLEKCEGVAFCNRTGVDEDDTARWARAKALADVAGFASGSRQKKIVNLLETEVDSFETGDRTEIRLAVLESIIRAGQSRGDSLGSSVSSVNRYAKLREEILDDATSMDDPSTRSETLARLAAVSGMPELVGHAIAVADKIDDDTGRANALVRIARVAPGDGGADEMEVLGELAEDRDWMSPYLAELRSGDARRRRIAVSALANFGEIALEPLVEALHDVDRTVRFVAISALGRLGGTAVIEPLSAAMSNKDPRQRVQAIAALGYTRSDEAIVNLMAALEEADPNVRAAAARALGEIRSPDSVPALMRAMTLSDEVDPVRRAVAISLLTCGTDESTARDALEWIAKIDSANDQRRRETIAGLVRFLPGGLREETASSLLREVETSDDDAHRGRVLVGISAGVDKREARRLLATALDIAESGTRLTTLVRLVPYLPERQVAEAVDAIRAMGGSPAFWVPKSSRRQLIDLLSDKLELSREAGRVAETVLAARREGLEVTSEQRIWAELASRLSDGSGATGPANHLIAKVRELIADEASGIAMNWISSGEALAESLRGELDSAVLLCQRLMELEYRRQQDERYLRNFLDRQEQVGAFKALVAGDNNRWALHYLGVGGVGKTMLMRHITSRLAKEHGLATARIDFDYLSPDFPSRKPGQLLLELGAGLRSYENVEHNFQELQSRVLELHEELGKKPPPDNPLANVAHSQFEHLLTPFITMLKTLKRPVLLILDTCEELAKLHPVSGKLPSIEATFEILRRIHNEVPTVRVIFSGRRPLARAGCDWNLDSSAMSEGDLLLPEREDYLMLQEVRGFDRKEAADYLMSIRRLSPNPRLLKAILDRSPDLGRTAIIERGSESTEDVSDRFNPFDLALYAEWISDDPELSPDVISSGDVDPYVERRIIHRIKRDHVRQLMPAAVLLKRFTWGMLRAALPVDKETFDEAFERLGDQEWINVQRDEASNLQFLEIDRGLLPRLAAYYQHPERRAEFEDARSLIGPAISKIVYDHELEDISVDHLNAALELLPFTEAEELWDSVVQRVGIERDWSWVNHVTQRLLGEDGAIGETDHPLRPAVESTGIAAAIHLAPSRDYTGNWRRIRELVAGDVGAGRETDPDPFLRRWFELRAIAGEIAARLSGNFLPAPNMPPDQSRWRECLSQLAEVIDAIELADDGAAIGGEFHNAQLAASVVAAIDGIIGQIEFDPYDELRSADKQELARLLTFLERVLASDVGADIAMFATVLIDRLTILMGGQGPVRLDDLASADLALHPWLDWRAGDLLHRLRYERLRAVPASTVASEPILLHEWLQEALESASSIDSERLASCILDRQLAIGVPDVNIEALEAAAAYNGERQPVYASHLAMPPLFVSVARALLARGEASRAMDLLEHNIRAATRGGRDPATIRAAELTKLEIMRRMRLADREPNLISRYSRSEDPSDVIAILPVVTVNEAPFKIEHAMADEAGILHAVWSSQSALTPPDRDRLVQAFQFRVERHDIKGSRLEQAHWFLDRIEPRQNRVAAACRGDGSKT